MMRFGLILLGFCFLKLCAFSQTVSTFAGSGTAGSTNGSGTSASFNLPTGVCSDVIGNIYVSDRYNHMIRKISPSGYVSTLAGSGIAGNVDATGTAASFSQPTGVCADASGNIYVADTYNHKIRKITTAGVVTTFAGTGFSGSNDGPGNIANFNHPAAVCATAPGEIYVADWGNNKIRKITTAGVVSTFAGSGNAGNINATGTAASFNLPTGICADASNNIYVVDYYNHKIRKITPGAIVTTFAGSGSMGMLDGVGTAASFNLPYGMCSSPSGDFYVADTYNHNIRKITVTGIVSTIAGSGSPGSLNGVGASASFNLPTGACTNAAGNLYVCDYANHKIRVIETSLSDIKDLNDKHNGFYFDYYPNPSHESLTINLNSSAYISIYDVKGVVVYSHLFSIGLHKINLFEMSNGLYVIKAESAEKIEIAKFIKN